MTRLPTPPPLWRAAALAAAAALSAAAPARAGFEQVADLFANGAWEQARGLVGRDAADARAAEAELWRSRLADNPAGALLLLHQGLDQKHLGRPVRARLALEAADLELGGGRPAEALKVLSPLLDEGDELPGDVPVAAARALVALGRGPRARELLAGVRATDPAYGLSRALLGDIAIAQGDGAQALRWYDAADQAEPELRRRTVSGRCRALLLGGRVADVEALVAQLAALDPGSLALLEIQRVLRDHEEETGARRPSYPQRAGGSIGSAGIGSNDATTAPLEPVDPVERSAPAAAPANTAASGRYTLQLGAFTDRGRALEFLQRQADSVAGLAIEDGVDARGQSVYRLRAGAWPDPAAAEAAAGELGARLGLDVIVVDREAAARAGG